MSAPERVMQHTNSRQLVAQASTDNNEMKPSKQHRVKHKIQRQYSMRCRSPSPSRKVEESFMNKLVNKLLPIADIIEGESLPRKGDDNHASSYSMDYADGVHSYTMRPRSKTFDPSTADGRLRRHSSVANCYAIHTNSLNNVDSGNSNSQQTSSTETYRKLYKTNENTKRRDSGGCAHASHVRLQKRSGEYKAVSMTLLKAEEQQQSSEGRERSVKSFGHLDQLRKKLAERGESIGLLDDKSESMKQATEGLSISAQKLAEKYKNKKWYEW